MNRAEMAVAFGAGVASPQGGCWGQFLLVLGHMKRTKDYFAWGCFPKIEWTIHDWEPPIGSGRFISRDCTMRRVRIIERAGEIYTYAAVDRETGEVPLQLADRAALVALCERLGWVIHEEKRAGGPRDERQRTGERHRSHPRRRVGGSSKYTSARKRQRDRTLAASSGGRR
jgi:hypothetical protein